MSDRETALVVRKCSPEWDRLSFELVKAGRVPVNRAWQADVNRRMVELRNGGRIMGERLA